MHSHTHCQATPAKAQTKAWQRVCLPHRTTKTTDKATDEKEHQANNSGSAKKRVQGLIEHSTLHQLLCCIDSLPAKAGQVVLPNKLIRQAQERYF
jgi:hypothetical protein